jgi:hypothetical protein
MSVLSSRLTAALGDRPLIALGFHEEDRADVRRVIRLALTDSGRLAQLEALADRLRASIGGLESDHAPFAHPAAACDWEGVGVLPMLALVAVADDVRAFHRARGVPPEISDRTLSDLGHQASVHRRTFGTFGLHTYQWMTASYSGALYRLGRLQFKPRLHNGEWMLSTHIPESGPLTPDAVDASFRQAIPFFAEHFPGTPATAFHCGSWLLDPRLAEVLKPESNMVRFQRRWALDGVSRVADDDAIYFVFRKRGEVDRSALPRDTSLQRAILDRLDAGGHWLARNGTIGLDTFAR